VRGQSWTFDSSLRSHCLAEHAASWANNSAVRLQEIGTGDRDVYNLRRVGGYGTSRATTPFMRSMPP
jgi:hypothetical protein